MEQTIDSCYRLEKAGFKTAATKNREIIDRERRLIVAYKNFPFIQQSRVDEFNAHLKKRTMKGNHPLTMMWQELSFIPVSAYPHTPPMDVIEKVEESQKIGCFDYHEVAYIRDVKDPIVFGRIHGCTDRFFVAQWDDDVSMEEILNHSKEMQVK